MEVSLAAVIAPSAFSTLFADVFDVAPARHRSTPSAEKPATVHPVALKSRRR
jgi:hypothetical protein